MANKRPSPQTAREAIELSIELWNVIAKVSQTTRKWDTAYQVEMHHYLNQCPLCEFAGKNAETLLAECRNCPVWPATTGNGHASLGPHDYFQCENDPESPYAHYIAAKAYGTPKKTKTAALNFVAFLQQKLDTLK